MYYVKRYTGNYVKRCSIRVIMKFILITLVLIFAIFAACDQKDDSHLENVFQITGSTPNDELEEFGFTLVDNSKITRHDDTKYYSHFKNGIRTDVFLSAKNRISSVQMFMDTITWNKLDKKIARDTAYIFSNTYQITFPRTEADMRRVVYTKPNGEKIDNFNPANLNRIILRLIGRKS